MDAIKSKIEVVNRTDKRKLINEIDKVRWDFGWLNSNFIRALFELPETVTYNEIYIYYLEQWIVAAKEANKRLKYAHVDESWFCDAYQPIENK